MGFELFQEQTIPAQQTVFMRKFAQDIKPGRVMELGCSSGDVLKLLSETGWDCVGIDIDAQALKKAAQYGTVYLRQGDEPLDFIEDSSFDLVCAFSVFHHIRDARKSFSEAVRCLKPGGTFLIIEYLEDSLFLHLGRNIFRDWEGMPILSRMYVKEWLALFSEFPLDLVAFYAIDQWVTVLGYFFYLFAKVSRVGKAISEKYHRKFFWFKKIELKRNYAGVHVVLWVLHKR